jgi:hypothetical protein
LFEGQQALPANYPLKMQETLGIVLKRNFYPDLNQPNRKEAA